MRVKIAINTPYTDNADIHIPDSTKLKTDCLPLSLVKAVDIKGSQYTRAGLQCFIYTPYHPTLLQNRENYFHYSPLKLNKA